MNETGEINDFKICIPVDLDAELKKEHEYMKMKSDELKTTFDEPLQVMHIEMTKCLWLSSLASKK